jgi:hypothetical protein
MTFWPSRLVRSVPPYEQTNWAASAPANRSAADRTIPRSRAGSATSMMRRREQRPDELERTLDEQEQQRARHQRAVGPHVRQEAPHQAAVVRLPEGLFFVKRDRGAHRVNSNRAARRLGTPNSSVGDGGGWYAGCTCAHRG